MDWREFLEENFMVKNIIVAASKLTYKSCT